MATPFVRPALLADPQPAAGSVVLVNARLFDGTGDEVKEGASLVVSGGRISEISDSPPAVGSASTIDLEGRFLMPGMIDCHAHLVASAQVITGEGVEPIRPAVTGHLIASELRKTLSMGITTVRDVGAYGDVIFEVRQAMRYGAFVGPRLLTCGQIVSPSSPGARHFEGMYREADGPDEMRKAAREQIRSGADFVKVMTTGARSVELENPDPAQLTREELAAVVEEVHRLGYRVAAHCEGIDGTELAIVEGVDTIEHGFNLHGRPDLLSQLAARDGVLVPTLSYLCDIAETRSEEWSPHLVERGRHNLQQAHETVRSALEAGVQMAMGFDSRPEHLAAMELSRLVEAGMSPESALLAATAVAARAVGLDHLVGTIEVGKFADLVVVETDPTEDVGVLSDPSQIHLVLRMGHRVRREL